MSRYVCENTSDEMLEVVVYIVCAATNSEPWSNKRDRRGPRELINQQQISLCPCTNAAPVCAQIQVDLQNIQNLQRPPVKQTSSSPNYTVDSNQI